MWFMPQDSSCLYRHIWSPSYVKANVDVRFITYEYNDFETSKFTTLLASVLNIWLLHYWYINLNIVLGISLFEAEQDASFPHIYSALSRKCWDNTIAVTTASLYMYFLLRDGYWAFAGTVISHSIYADGSQIIEHKKWELRFSRNKFYTLKLIIHLSTNCSTVVLRVRWPLQLAAKSVSRSLVLGCARCQKERHF
jgi:hypothetical protein